jgi:hypothetical protein
MKILVQEERSQGTSGGGACAAASQRTGDNSGTGRVHESSRPLVFRLGHLFDYPLLSFFSSFSVVAFGSQRYEVLGVLPGSVA